MNERKETQFQNLVEYIYDSTGNAVDFAKALHSCFFTQAEIRDALACHDFYDCVQNVIIDEAYGIECVHIEKIDGYIALWETVNDAFPQNIGEMRHGKAWYASTYKDGEEIWVAMDDSDGYCWVEEFDTMEMAIDYLIGACDADGNYPKDGELACQTGDL